MLEFCCILVESNNNVEATQLANPVTMTLQLLFLIDGSFIKYIIVTIWRLVKILLIQWEIEKEK